MEKKVREFLKSHDLYPERGIHNESGTLIGLGDLLNNFAKSLSPSTDSSEVSDEEIERMALERFKIEGWEMKHPVEGVTRGSLQINHKLAFIEGFKKCLELRSKLKSQWVSVDEFNWLVKNEDEIKQALVNHNLPDEVYEGFGKLFKHLKNES